VVVVLISLAVGLMVGQPQRPTPTAAPTATAIAEPTATLLPVQTLTAIPTEAPSLPPTHAATPTDTPMPVPTRSPTPDRPTEGAPWNQPADGMEMVYVPAGEFEMGSTGGASDEKPVHTVYLDAFWIDRTEVTNAQFAAFLNEQGNREEGGVTWLDLEDEDCLIERAGGEYRAAEGYAGHPAIEVTWYGAVAYCAWAGARLPTEAEWEKAARGTDGRVYPWGDEFNGSRLNFCDRNCKYDWKDTEADDGYARTAPVGSYPAGASPYGALDMAGNVWEWVADWYDGDYYRNSPARNPQGPPTGDARVLRGGSWRYYGIFVRGAYRLWVNPDVAYNNLGFRCARGSP
jgi:formylglycine-generating enzyme required for sulfatase activity